MLTRHFASVFTSSFLSLVLCFWSTHLHSEAAWKHSGTIKMAGGTAHITFMQDIGNQLNERNPEFKVLIAGGGSGVGVQKLGAGLVDLANTGRPLSSEEKKRYGLSSYPLAYDAITFIVNPKNPVNNLTFSDLQKIFSGEIKTWGKWIKGSKQPIHVYVRDEASGTQDIFVEKVLKQKRLAHSANFTNSQGSMKIAVSNDPHGIGFVGFGYLDETVKDLRLNGIKVSKATIKNRNYPLVRILYVNSHKKKTPLVQEFLTYLQGPESAEIMSKWGLVPIYNPKAKK